MTGKANVLTLLISMLPALIAAPSRADVFTLDSSSDLDYSGTLSINIVLNVPGSPTGSGSAPFVATVPGSLHTGLKGTINAVSNGSVLTFTGGSAITFTNPDALAFTADVPISGGAPNVSVKLVSKIHDVVLDVTGSVALVGPPGNQTFDTTGLAVTTLAGTLDGSFAACTPVCGTPVDISGPLVEPGDPPDILPAGQGSFISGAKTSISFPAFIVNHDSVDVTVDVSPGITATGTFIIDQTTDAHIFASVPEPSSWVLLAAGLATLVPTWRRRSTRGTKR